MKVRKARKSIDSSSFRHQSTPWRRCSLVPGRPPQQHGQVRWHQQQLSLFASPALCGRRVYFLNGGDFRCPAREQSDEAGNRSGLPGCLDHAPAIGQQFQFDLFPGLMPRCCSTSLLKVTCARAVTVNVVMAFSHRLNDLFMVMQNHITPSACRTGPGFCDALHGVAFLRR